MFFFFWSQIKLIIYLFVGFLKSDKINNRSLCCFFEVLQWVYGLFTLHSHFLFFFVWQVKKTTAYLKALEELRHHQEVLASCHGTPSTLPLAPPSTSSAPPHSTPSLPVSPPKQTWVLSLADNDNIYSKKRYRKIIYNRKNLVPILKPSRRPLMAVSLRYLGFCTLWSRKYSYYIYEEKFFVKCVFKG